MTEPYVRRYTHLLTELQVQYFPLFSKVDMVGPLPAIPPCFSILMSGYPMTRNYALTLTRPCPRLLDSISESLTQLYGSMLDLSTA
jgi:hypothetical protein